MMADLEELDLDAFIANIEQSAPQEDLQNGELGLGHRCEECDVMLEEQDDGTFICPSCSAQATNIQQLEATECFLDAETGRNVFGQVVKLTKKKSFEVDYGWAWSTDEAIVHLLSLQVDVLEEIELVSKDKFRSGINNMWLKFWVQNVAPFIQDQYQEGDLIPIEAVKSLKFRDIEVLVKVKDKVMIPERHIVKRRAELRQYQMLNIKFSKHKPSNLQLPINNDNNQLNTSKSSDENSDPGNNSQAINNRLFQSPIPVMDHNESNMNDEQIDNNMNSQEPNLQQCPKKFISESIADHQSEYNSIDADTINDGVQYGPQELPDRSKTKDIRMDSVSILTLNRTLAFLEAAARCLGEPLFASTIIRCCNQRLIPFYGAHKNLPSGMNLNYLDIPMFRKIRPPSPSQLTSAAYLLIHKIYRDNLPVLLPMPSFTQIIETIMVDLNLPKDLINYMDNKRLNFNTFKQTKPSRLDINQKRVAPLPQYDRWAFVILLGQLKKLFGLNDQSIANQKKYVKKVAKETSGGDSSQRSNGSATNNDNNNFIILDWVKQLSIKLQLIMSYDPYLLFHPMTNIKSLQPNPQLYKYIDTVLDDTVTAQTKLDTGMVKWDSTYRNELSDFFSRHVPKPHDLDGKIIYEDYLDKPIDYKHPIRDSLLRTERFWSSTVAKHSRINKLLFEDYMNHKITIGDDIIEPWSIYDDQLPGNITKFEVLTSWPYCFKLLLSIGAFICYCEPRDLLREFRFVEEYLNPDSIVVRKRLSKGTPTPPPCE